MPLNAYEQSEIRYALATGDGKVLADIVSSKPFLDYEDLESFVRRAPGGSRAVGSHGIRCGDTLIRSRYNRPYVAEE